MAIALDIPSLLNPVPPPAAGDAPAEPNETPPKLREARAAIEEARRIEDPASYPEGDPRRANPKKAEWPKIVELAGNCLRSTAKDLHVAARMTEALLQVNGFAGVRDGLSVMRQLVEKFWDTLYPRIDDGDMEVRAGPFNWLDSFDKGSRFASSLCLWPLVSANNASLAYFNFKPPGNAPPTGQADIEKTVGAAPLEACEKTAKEIEGCRQELDGLQKALSVKMDDEKANLKRAPGLTSVRKAVDDCRQVINQIVERKRPPAAPKPDKAPDQPGAAPTSAASLSPAAMRAEIYRQLSQAAARLRDLEPHSPVPSMIERAVEYGRMAFPELLKEMVREPKMLADLYREYGVKDAGAAKK